MITEQDIYMDSHFRQGRGKGYMEQVRTIEVSRLRDAITDVLHFASTKVSQRKLEEYIREQFKAVLEEDKHV